MKTEKEKMLAGEIYDANNDRDLLKERLICNELCYEYNKLRPSQNSEKYNILKSLFNKIGEKFIIEPTFFCDYGYNIEIGENFYANHNFVILDGAKVTIGNNVFIAPNCSLYTAGHPIDVESRNRGLEYAYPITIGNNVWIGGGTIILPGVTIGDNSTIGAGSVVTKDIPTNSLAFGNPCRVIRNLTQEK